MSLGDFERLSTIKDSIYGEVALCWDPERDEKVAIKVTQRDKLQGKVFLENPLGEVKVLQRLHSPPLSGDKRSPVKGEQTPRKRLPQPVSDPGQRYIVGMRAAGRDDHCDWLALEYCPGGELFSLVLEKKLNMALTRKLFRQLVLAMNWVHQLGICHLDVSLENLLLDANQDLKLCDFGLAMEGRMFKGRRGKENYMAPEVYAGTTYDGRQADCWSVGMVLFTMLTGSPLYAKPTLQDSNCRLALRAGRVGLKKVLDAWGIPVPAGALDVMAALLRPEGERMSMAELLLVPWLADIMVNEKTTPQKFALEPTESKKTETAMTLPSMIR
eukprot:g75061.t1